MSTIINKGNKANVNVNLIIMITLSGKDSTKNCTFKIYKISDVNIYGLPPKAVVQNSLIVLPIKVLILHSKN
jgi:hypothetical protein